MLNLLCDVECRERREHSERLIVETVMTSTLYSREGEYIEMGIVSGPRSFRNSALKRKHGKENQ